MKTHNITVIGDAAFISTRIEHGESVSILSESISENKRNHGYSIILITGAESSGKTILAKILTSRTKGNIYFEGKNIINAEDSNYYGRTMNKLSGNYVVDDGHKSHQGELKKIISKVVAGNGSIIIFSRNALSLNISHFFEKYSLNHAGLLKIKYSRAI